MYTSIIIALIFVFLLSLIGTGIVNIIFRFLGKRGYLGNLFPNVRGGIPRAVGIVPFVILAFYFLPGYNSLILIIGVFALIDDILGRKKSPFGVEWGQLCWISTHSMRRFAFMHGFARITFLFVQFFVKHRRTSHISHRMALKSSGIERG